ncbi:class 1 fructose-bisphosphatase [Methylobrevis albus]|uniref:Fructose-1,6-bisphosphatase class 1 n=1 Tax=Methylobrevis albus TaxID=2793297 RepID=A0A931HYZ4_9HYPH|nr:class 1 fructose-bisphosphatase [Methylobrevis albus]MBH0236210.1 class 1 fructose-bisphosphatase [Methylobrevis albus]
MISLEDHLAAAAGADPQRLAAVAAVRAIAATGIALGARLADGALFEEPGRIVGVNSDGDKQKALDVAAHGMFTDALLAAGVAAVGSEEAEAVIPGDPAGLVAAAFDPIDGSSHIGLAAALGTFFSVLPAVPGGDAFLQAGRNQIAAGYLIYGHETVLGLTLGDGTYLFTLDRRDGRFKGGRKLQVPATSGEFGADMANRRHWPAKLTRFADAALAGAAGPRGRDLRLRWQSAAVVDMHRILLAGGLFLYPADARPDAANGRLRHVYEVNPIAMLVEQAGGRATDGNGAAILDKVPAHLHARAPIVCGSADEVAQYEAG